MFRKLGTEQREAVAIFLIWIIAGMTFAILGPSLKHSLIPGTEGLAWIAMAVAFAISMIVVTRSNIRMGMMPMVMIGLVGGVFGSKGIVDLSATALVFTWKFFVLGFTGLGLGVWSGILTKRFLGLIPDYLTHQRQMKELDERIAEWQNRPEPEREPVPLSPAAELALLVAIEYRFLNPSKSPDEEFVIPDEFGVMKSLIQGIFCTMAVQVLFSSEPTAFRAFFVVLVLASVVWFEWWYKRAQKRIAEKNSVPDPEMEQWKTDFVSSIRNRRAELRRPALADSCSTTN